MTSSNDLVLAVQHTTNCAIHTFSSSIMAHKTDIKLTANVTLQLREEDVIPSPLSKRELQFPS